MALAAHTNELQALREEFGRLADRYFEASRTRVPFRPGVDPVPVSGKLLDAADLAQLIDASLDLWLTAGRHAAEFERRLAREVGARSALLVNSGSSANLLAVSSLTSPLLGDRALRPGDEAITVAAGFPTTVNPIVQNGLVPVFLDIRLGTYNVDVSALEEALSPKTRAIVLAHTLGNPFDLDAVVDFAQRHGLWLIEDACDALGATYRGKPIGAFGHLATASFYPAHQITMGEGGAVLVNAPGLHRLAESFRDWGRDCWCAPGQDGTCRKRFGWSLGELPCGYDHKYTYSHIGYNLKATDMQAALGVSQLDKLPEFVERRRANFAHLRAGLADLEAFFLLPETTPQSEPSPFGFPIAIRPEAPFSRDDVVRGLEERKIGTRLLFAGNLTRQPAYREVTCRKIGDLPKTDFAMERVFWTGVWPGLSTAHLDFVLETLHEIANRP